MPTVLFKRGQPSSNPSGRPKKRVKLERLIQRALERDADGNPFDGPSRLNRAVEGILAIAEDTKDTAPNVRLKAWTELLHMAYGKPRQQVDISAVVSFADLVAASEGAQLLPVATPAPVVVEAREPLQVAPPAKSVEPVEETHQLELVPVRPRKGKA